MTETRTRLLLVTPSDLNPESFAPVLADALDAGDVAAVLLALSTTDDAAWQRAASVLCPVAQERGAAFLLRDRIDMAREVGADGVHMTGGNPSIERAQARLKPDMIVGAGDCTTRHAAMVAGECTPDYVLLGRLDPEEDIPATHNLIDWWVEIFELPCVALVTEGWEAAADAAQSGADFVALRDMVWNDVRGAAEAVRHAHALCGHATEAAA